MKIIKINEGITQDKETGNFIVNFEYDGDEDIIHLKKPNIYQTEFGSNVYWFGYKIDDSVNRKKRANFIHWLKGITEEKPTEYQYKRIINEPISMLNRIKPLNTFSVFIAPKSERSNLCNKIVECCFSFLQHTTVPISIEVLKSSPENVKFDWDRFDMNFTGDKHSYDEIKKYVNDILLPKIHNLDYFSIAQNVKPKYRKYIYDYLYLQDKSKNILFKLMESDNILLVDDVKTSGATLEEIIRIIRLFNNKSSIYIFTLIGE